MRAEFGNISKIPGGFWQWPHFSPRELMDKTSGAIIVETDFLDRLERARAQYGRPMIINSGYRTPEHNAAVSPTGEDGPHTTGRAVDVRVYGAYALELLRHALDVGFTGIGVKQVGDFASRFIHLDDLEAPDYPRPTIWTY